MFLEAKYCFHISFFFYTFLHFFFYFCLFWEGVLAKGQTLSGHFGQALLGFHALESKMK